VYKFTQLFLLLLLTVTNVVTAESIYVSQAFNVGLHEDKTIDSPIITLVQSGSELELIKSEDVFTYVSTTDGKRGWIDNTYVTNVAIQNPSSSTEQSLLQAQLDAALAENQQLISLAQEGRDSAILALQSEHKALQQAFNSEQLKGGELQVELAELRKRVGQDNNNAALYDEIEGLQQDRKTLEIQLAAVLEREGITSTAELSPVSASGTSWRNTLIYFSLAIFFGFCVGIYLMDYINRRRHAGLRI
jgi:SH3 domain protein